MGDMRLESLGGKIFILILLSLISGSSILANTLINSNKFDKNILSDKDLVITLICPTDLSASCNISEHPAYVDFAAFMAAGGTASSNCGSIVSGSFSLFSENSDLLNCPETFTRTYEILDDCGSPLAQCAQLIMVNDNELPVFTSAPADITVECIGDVPMMTSLGYTDNCDAAGSVAGVDGSLTGGNCGGTITRTWNFTDVCGNAALPVSQTITIDDNELPVFTVAPADMELVVRLLCQLMVRMQILYFKMLIIRHVQPRKI